MMRRIIVDSQSNGLFKGVSLEQNYDQRGGLCQAGEDDVVITTNTIDPDYLKYWSNLGFSIPHLLIAGPFDPQRTLSELIVRNTNVQKELRDIIGQNSSRLEFFCIEESEKKLSEVLGIPSYCNFDIAIELSRKHAFKMLCEDIGLPTAPWVSCETVQELFDVGSNFLAEQGPFLVKSNDGTGGIACGGMLKVTDEGMLLDGIQHAKEFVYPIVLEKIIEPKDSEIALHWEINAGGNLSNVNFFHQFSDNFGYTGTSYPVEAHSVLGSIRGQLEERMFPFLRKSGGLGYFCCDIIIDSTGDVYWIDFNPRKGAIIYVYDMARRLAEIIFDNKPVHFWHRHFQYDVQGNGLPLKSILERLNDVLQPINGGVAVISNPGVIPFGYLDITGVSIQSTEEAKRIFCNASMRMNKG